MYTVPILLTKQLIIAFTGCILQGAPFFFLQIVTKLHSVENSCSNWIRCLLTSEESFQFPSFVIQIWGLFGVEDDTENMHNNTRRGSLQLRHDNNSNDCLASCSTLEFWHLFGQSFDMLIFCFLLFLMSQKTHKKTVVLYKEGRTWGLCCPKKKKTKWLLFSPFVTHITHQLLPPTSFFDLSCRNNLSPDVPIKADLQISTITNRQSDKIAYKSQTRRRKKRQHLFFKETKWNVLQELFACFYHSQFFFLLSFILSVVLIQPTDPHPSLRMRVLLILMAPRGWAHPMCNRKRCKALSDRNMC